MLPWRRLESRKNLFFCPVAPSSLPVVSAGRRRGGVTTPSRAVALLLWRLAPVVAAVVTAVVAAVVPVVPALVEALLVAAGAWPRPPVVSALVLHVGGLLRLNGPVPAVTPASERLLLLPLKLRLGVGRSRTQQTLLSGMLVGLVMSAVWRAVVSMVVVAGRWRVAVLPLARLVSVHIVTQSSEPSLAQMSLLPVGIEAQLRLPGFPVPSFPVAGLQDLRWDLRSTQEGRFEHKTICIHGILELHSDCKVLTDITQQWDW